MWPSTGQLVALPAGGILPPGTIHDAVGSFQMESFKEDVGTPIVAIGAYARTVRRRLIDLAGKIVSHSEKIVLKVSDACFDALELGRLFERCKAVMPIG